MIGYAGAQNSLPMHHVAGAVHGTVGVDIGGPTAALPSTERVAAWGDGGHVVAVRGQYPEVVGKRLGGGHLQRGEPVRIGSSGGLLLVGKARAHLHTGD